MKIIQKYIYHLLLLILFIVLFLGGLGGFWIKYVIYAGFALSILLLVFIKVTKGKINTPSYFKIFIVFLLTVLINLLWSVDRSNSREYLLLFTSGGLFWIGFYNFGKKDIEKYINPSLIVLGTLFSCMYIYNLVFNNAEPVPRSLYAFTSAYKNHNHIGDFWAMMMLISFYKLLKDYKQMFFWILFFASFHFLTISLSRSAYLALFISMFYILQKKNLGNKGKIIFFVVSFLLLEMFLLVGVTKRLIFHRSVYFQGVMGMLKHPLGVGFGNFNIISSDKSNQIWGLTAYSSIAHNIVIEAISGIGILATSFIIWLFNVLVEFWHKRKKEGELIRSLFILLTINFFLDITYYIPTMLWLWFIFLGLGMSFSGNNIEYRNHKKR